MAADLHQNCRLLITTLTPLHIGSGKRLRQGLDFIERNNRLWIAHQGKVMNYLLEQIQQQTAESGLAAALAGLKLTNWEWQDDDFDPARGLFTYSLAGSTSTSGKEGELHEFIKDVYGQPYLPGSSLKGALRSALLRWKLRPEEKKLGYADIYKKLYRRNYDGRFAAQRIERQQFNPNRDEDAASPNYNLWRAFQVTDSLPKPASTLALGKAAIYPKGKPSLDLEVIPAGVSLESTCQLDRWLLNRDERRERDPERKLWFWRERGLFDLAQLCQNLHSDAWKLLEQEEYFWSLLKEQVQQPDLIQTCEIALQQVENLCNIWSEVGERTDEFLLQVGKGGGWRGKTLGGILINKLGGDFDRLVDDFKLGKRDLWKEVEDDLIPTTRLLVNCGGQTYAPLGWLRIKMERVS